MTRRPAFGRWERSEVVRNAEEVDREHLTPWGALRYAAGGAAVLAFATAVAGPTAGVVCASGAINAGSVGVTSGLARPRLVMGVSILALASAAFLGSITASSPPVAVATIAAIGVVAGFLARAGPAALNVGVQAMVGFVTLGRFPGSPETAALVALGIVAGGAVQIVLGEVLRDEALRGAYRRLRATGSLGWAPSPREWNADRHEPSRRLVRRFGRAILRPDAAARAHALRLALCLAVAHSLSFVLSDERGYWISLTVLNVLRPDWVTTAGRGIDRWVGTLVGVLAVGTVASAVDPRGAVLVVAIGVLVWAAFAVQPVNYAAYCAFVAGFVVMLLQVVDAEPASSALYRALDTTLGGALAVGTHALLRERDGSPPR